MAPPFSVSVACAFAGAGGQVEEDVVRAVAVGHHAARVAHVGGGERADIQLVDRRAGRRGVAGVDVGVGVEDRCVVVGGRRADVRNFRQDRLVLLVGRRILRGVEGAVRGFGSQRHGPVEQACHLRECAIGHLQKAHAFSGVGLRLGQGHAGWPAGRRPAKDRLRRRRRS